MSDAHKTPTPSGTDHRETAQDATTKYGKLYPSAIGDHDGLSNGGNTNVIGDPLTHESIRQPIRRPAKSDGTRLAAREVPRWME